MFLSPFRLDLILRGAGRLLGSLGVPASSSVRVL